MNKVSWHCAEAGVFCDALCLARHANLGVKLSDLFSQSEYLRVEDIASFLCLSESDWQGLEMAILAAAFDASGHEADQRIMVVAGFISSAGDWAEFSKKRNRADQLNDKREHRFIGGEAWYEDWARSGAVAVKCPSQDRGELSEMRGYRRI